MSSTVTLDTSGLDAYQNALRRKLASLVSQAAEFGAEDMQRRIKEGPKSGIHHSGLPNQSSASGESPAHQYGELERSIRAHTERAESDLTASADVHSEIGPMLEYGTVHIAPRPFAAPATESVKRFVDEKARSL